MELQELLLEYMKKNSELFYGQRICTAPRRKIAKKLGIHPSTIWRGLKTLQGSKKIRSYFSNGSASLHIIRR